MSSVADTEPPESEPRDTELPDTELPDTELPDAELPDAELPDGADTSLLGPRTKVRRLPERGHYDRSTIHAVLDEGFICHVAFATDEGPVVVPTAYARMGDALYLHGAAGNHLLRAVGEGARVCVTVTLVDALVLARSTFHHSINYRSVMVFGTAHEVSDDEEKSTALDAVVEHIVPGRTADARGPNSSELRATRVVRVDVDEASAKVRTGGPKDDAEDIALDEVWAGELPFVVTAGVPLPDDHDPVSPPVPGYLTGYRRPGWPAG